MQTADNKRFVYEFGRFVLNAEDKSLLAEGVPIHLPEKEFRTLLLLVENSGRSLSKEEMINAIWADTFVEEGNLAKQISRIRKVVDSNGDRYIETIPKHGYRFSGEVRRRELENGRPGIVEIKDEPVRSAASRWWWLAVPAAAILIALPLAWWFFGERSPVAAAVPDPSAPVRLTTDPEHDTGPVWLADGRIRFSRVYQDGTSSFFVMNADGSNAVPIKEPEGLKVLSWSPNEKKMIYQKIGDNTVTYLSWSDGSGEVRLPMRSGTWSADSKSIVYHQQVAAGNYDIFIYSLDTGRTRNVTNSDVFEVDPSFSPDGKKIVFSSHRDGNQEIYVMDLATGAIQRMTNDRGLDTHAAFSPDGTQILFTSNRDKENADVYIMNAAGGEPFKVTKWDKSNETAGPGSWSPDGTQIAFFSDMNQRDDIFTVSAETIKPRPLITDADRELRTGVYSPDGAKIVYSSETPDRTGELRVFDFATQRSSVLRKTELPHVIARWSPDGSRIVFSDRLGGNSEIVSIASNGGDLINLSSDPGLDASPAWSPDGQRIVFVSDRDESSGGLRLYTMKADGTDLSPVTASKGWESDPVWSANSNEIFFVCDRDDSPGDLLDVCTIKPDGSGERRVIFRRGHDSSPAVSPDGKRVAFVSTHDGNPEIYIVNTDGSNLLRLTRNRADDVWPAWSPDGSRLIFSSNRTGKLAIFDVEVPL